MRYLSRLTPAETLLVLQDKKAVIKELLKVTFMDLLLKQVVKTFDLARQPSSRDSMRIYKYARKGKNFFGYQPLQHETVFLTPFQNSKSSQILFRHIVRMGYQNAQSEAAFHTLVSNAPGVRNCFKRNFLQAIFGGFNITPEGLDLRFKIQSEIAQLENELPPLLLNDYEKALEILKEIKGNIFLLSNIEFDLLKEIDKELLTEMSRQDRSSGDHSGTGCTGSVWESYDSFDSSCSGDSGGGSGCGGSGCSGCGGGCGGGD